MPSTPETTKDPSQVEIVQVPSIVTSKLGPGATIPMRLDPRILSRMEDSITRMKSDYGDALIAQVVKCLGMLSDMMNDALVKSEGCAAIYRLNHEIRGIAGTFDRPIASRISASLCTYMDGIKTPPNLHILQVHLEALQAASIETPEPSDDVTKETVSGLEKMVQQVLLESQSAAE